MMQKLPILCRREKVLKCIGMYKRGNVPSGACRAAERGGSHAILFAES